MEQAATLLQDALPASSVPKVSWNLAWGDFIGEARSKGAVTDAQWLEYVLFGIELKFFHRPKIRQGVTAPFGFLVTGPRLPNRPTSVQLHATLSGLTVNTTPSKLLDLPASRISIARRGATSCSRAMALDSSPGKHTLQMTVLVAVVDQKDEKKELGSRTFSYQAPLEIVPPNDSIVSTVADPSLVDSIRRSLKIQTLNRYSPDNLSPSFDCKDPPINLAFEVFGRPRDGTQAGKEISLGEVSFLKGSEGAYGVGGQFPADATRADFIFRPSVKAAEANYRLTEIWTGPDIVFENEMVPSFKP
ncbi:MAG: hypothetical protein JSR52_13295 [Planctomycetes bacterium]|nr:hypothetical protein [Planctomycetota bacterium]